MALTNKLTAIADAIRTKTGKTDPMTLDQMVTEIDGIATGGGSTEEWIGDGNTHIWITLHEGRTSPMLGVCPKGTVTVDWGDGTTPDVLTGTSTSAVKWTPAHEYAKPGDYVITLTVDGEMGFYGSYEGAVLLQYSSVDDDRSEVYRSSVKKIEIGSGVTSIAYNAFGSCYSLASIVIPEGVTRIGSNAFSRCYSLASIVIPEGVTRIGSNAFNSCYSLASIVIPDSVTNIGEYAFNSCYSLTSVVISESVTSIYSGTFGGCHSLASIVIPDSVTNIGEYVFSYSYGMRYYDFTKHTAVPTLANANAFNRIPADCEIRVPAALYDEWKAATNWTSFASQIVAA